MAETTAAKQDPRIYFPAERTFLAWIRTGLALMGAGFAVARFGLCSRDGVDARSRNCTLDRLSLASGVALVLVGGAITLKSVFDHVRIVRELREGTWRAGQVSASAIALGGTLALVGLAMAVYLRVIR